MTKYYMQGDSAMPIRKQKNILSWEIYEDAVFYDMWVVKPKGYTGYQKSFHLDLEEEALRLRDYLNSLEIPE